MLMQHPQDNLAPIITYIIAPIHRPSLLNKTKKTTLSDVKEK